MAIIDVVKYNGSPDVLAWKYPSEELSTWTQLIVNESQEAILFRGGQCFDVFLSGHHILETENIPLLNNLVKLPFGGRSPFTAEVWFVNKQSSLDIKWGTPSPIQLQDPKYSLFIPIRAYGQFGICIEDSTLFLSKLVGTLPIFDKTSILKYFRGLYLTTVKDTISSYVVHHQISIMEINAYLEELSIHLQEKMQHVLQEYGIRLINFYANDISVPEDDTAVMKLKEALAKKAEMNIIGYNYHQERSFNTLEGAANNSGSSAHLMGAGLGLGIGSAMGGAVGHQFSNITNVLDTTPTEPTKVEEIKTPSSSKCSNCGFPRSATMKFCPECGQPLLKSCPSCNAKLQGSHKFCPECGSKTA